MQNAITWAYLHWVGAFTRYAAGLGLQKMDEWMKKSGEDKLRDLITVYDRGDIDDRMPIHKFFRQLKHYPNRQALAFVKTGLAATRECTQDLIDISVARLNAKFEIQHTVKHKDKNLRLQTKKFDDGQLDEDRMMRNLVYWYVDLFQFSSGTVAVGGQAPNEASSPIQC